MKLREKWNHLINTLLPTYRSKVGAVLLLGTMAGLGCYLIYMSRVWSYLGDDPATCINCHVMDSYYATWLHSSHGRDATCNDCHVPHDNIFSKYYFKATDGLRHSYVFTMRGEPQAMKAIPASQRVIYNNCVRCHDHLNTEMVKTGLLSGNQISDDSNFACWDCHREVPHGGVATLSRTPNAITPLPKSPVPEWISKLKSKN